MAGSFIPLFPRVTHRWITSGLNRLPVARCIALETGVNGLKVLTSISKELTKEVHVNSEDNRCNHNSCRVSKSLTLQRRTFSTIVTSSAAASSPFSLRTIPASETSFALIAQLLNRLSKTFFRALSQLRLGSVFMRQEFLPCPKHTASQEFFS